MKIKKIERKRGEENEKIFNILLIVCILVVATDIVLAKVSFGGWDKWDEELPPWDNKNWKEAYSMAVSFPLLEGSVFWF